MVFFTYDKYDFNTFIDARTYPIRFENLLLFIPLPLLMVYVSLALLPQKNYSKNISKFIQLVTAIIGLICFSAVYIYVLTKTIVIHDTVEHTYNDLSAITKVSIYLSYALIYPLMATTVGISIKLVKNWYIKTLEAEKLLKQKRLTELSIFKSKIHPKILLQSLENINEKLNENSEKSPTMILYLSDLLDYILYQENKLTPLSKEIDIVKKYIVLTNADENFSRAFHFNISGDMESFSIIPLTLLHLIEFLLELHQLNQNKFSQVSVIIERQNNSLDIELNIEDFNAANSLNNFVEKEVEAIKNSIQIFYPEQCYFSYDYGNTFSLHLKLLHITTIPANLMSA